MTRARSAGATCRGSSGARFNNNTRRDAARSLETSTRARESRLSTRFSPISRFQHLIASPFQLSYELL
jgi:hypothetical protein